MAAAAVVVTAAAADVMIDLLLEETTVDGTLVAVDVIVALEGAQIAEAAAGAIAGEEIRDLHRTGETALGPETEVARESSACLHSTP